MSESNIILSISTERDLLPKNSVDQEVRGIFLIEPPRAQVNAPKPGADIILLLDTSGSMDHKFHDSGKSKRQIVVEAAKSLVPLMNDRDTLSAISFNTTATLMLDHERKSANTRVMSMLDELLNQSGTTDFEKAMQLCQIVVRNRKNPVTKVIFLTDGHPYGGDLNQALVIASEIVREGATLDSMGIGGDFNFDTMRQFSAFSGGVTENIVRINDTQNIFRQILKSGQDAVATNIQLNFLFGKHVRDVKLYQTAPEKRLLNGSVTVRRDGTLVELRAGDLPMGGVKQYGMRCNVDLPDAPFVRVADLVVSYLDPVSDAVRKMDLQWNINLSDPAQGASAILHNSFVSDVFREVELLMDFENALALAKADRLPEAVKKFHGLVDHAKQLGLMEQAAEFQKAYEKLINGQNLTQEELNRMLHQSSRASRVRKTTTTGAEKKL